MKLHITRPPSLALLAQLAAFILGAGVIAAAGYGFGVSTVPAAPEACTTALNTASRIFIAQTNLISAVKAQSTEGREKFEANTAVVDGLFAEIDDFTPDFNQAADECTGGAS